MKKITILRLYAALMFVAIIAIDIIVIPKYYNWIIIPMNILALTSIYLSIFVYTVSRIKILQQWKDDLIMCPSQCFLYFSFDDKIYELYLRWRHRDPWTATLSGPYTQIGNTYIEDADSVNVQLDVPDYSHDQLDKIKKVSYQLAIKYLSSY